ncbi:MAG: hypothetical protein U0974_03125 [Gemmatimonadales bacterium]|nr:hypothetical protein [Gemmatimonadales bacterium]
MTALRLLRPGESRIVEVEPGSLRDVPLDSILVSCDGSTWFERFASTLSHARQYPWLPLAIGVASTQKGDNPYFSLCEGIDVALWSNGGGSSREVQQVRSAVRARPAPTAARFADHLARRISPALKQPLQDILDSVPIARRTGSMMRSHGQWGPPQWRALFRMVQLFGDAGGSTLPLKALAERRELVPKTVWRWSNALFGITWLGLREWQAWEAVTERALRRAGYCSGPE